MSLQFRKSIINILILTLCLLMIQTEGSIKKILGGKVSKMKNENDLIDGLIADRFNSCPPKCSKRNPLNS